MTWLEHRAGSLSQRSSHWMTRPGQTNPRESDAAPAGQCWSVLPSRANYHSTQLAIRGAGPLALSVCECDQVWGLITRVATLERRWGDGETDKIARLHRSGVGCEGRQSRAIVMKTEHCWALVDRSEVCWIFAEIEMLTSDLTRQKFWFILWLKDKPRKQAK